MNPDYDPKARVEAAERWMAIWGRASDVFSLLYRRARRRGNEEEARGFSRLAGRASGRRLTAIGRMWGARSFVAPEPPHERPEVPPEGTLCLICGHDVCPACKTWCDTVVTTDDDMIVCCDGGCIYSEAELRWQVDNAPEMLIQGILSAAEYRIHAPSPSEDNP